MIEKSDLLECLREMDKNIDDIFLSQEYEDTMINKIETLLQRIHVNKVTHDVLQTVIDWHKTRHKNLRKKMIQLYVQRDSITDEIMALQNAHVGNERYDSTLTDDENNSD